MALGTPFAGVPPPPCVTGPLWVPMGPLMRVGSLLPRKEVGLDLFFPSQMQENLKVRGVRPGWGVRTPTRRVWGHTWVPGGVRVCVHQGVCGAVCASARGDGAWHTLVRVFWRRRAHVRTQARPRVQGLACTCMRAHLPPLLCTHTELCRRAHACPCAHR